MYEIEDVIERSILYKYTFTVPSQQQIHSLKVGNLVKLIFREYEDDEFDNQSVIQVDTRKGGSPLPSPTSGTTSTSGSVSNNTSPSIKNGIDNVGGSTSPAAATAAPVTPQETQYHAERMWVKITSVDDQHQHFEGTLDNQPFSLKSIMSGDPVVFRANQILMIYGQTNQISYLSDEQRILTSQFCLISRMALDQKNGVGYIFREDPSKAIANDSGWRIFQGDESDEYMENKSNYQTTTIAAVLNQDDTFLHLLQYPVDTCFEKDSNGVWKEIV
ncbi:hypothetical protein PPL_09649 [Heterostelium album PN500]|uniref:Immunity protein Imm33 domain-containing protein n=1 Tax=Heterostelium pallidum (strain ATCC 26659 / Pp 5 / PN500) TaxID=670386 RepID=D3BNX8_HETP5|nr:hypothetical protein PPL_09649 [Heterostelium album PN500]EFA76897.1 hypothetical protein PPL_09649 [Heterostelium album PN500]|eukprot:XP_020429029.1 hypothetical protein PPL_09649 [Heterostelium album PN500]